MSATENYRLIETPDREVLLHIEDLQVHFRTTSGTVRAVDGVTLDVLRGKTIAVVGESGCGKSITARAVLGLLPQENTDVSGRISFQRRSGEVVDVATLPRRGKALREIRGGEIAMIFQEPMTSLNPVYTVGNQILEAIYLHTKDRGPKAYARAVDLLSLVGISEPETRLKAYPHQMSGGMRQRVMIAMALASNPSLLLADEPTTALDVTVQAQILDLIRRLQEEMGMSVIFITHDLGVVAEMAHEVAVIYLGQVVEYAEVNDLFDRPAHPYTRGLLNSLPRIGATERLQPIAGSVPDPRDRHDGCRFAGRCAFRMAKCSEEPPLFTMANNHKARCWLLEDEGVRSHE